MFSFLCANQHHCHITHILRDNCSASFYQALMDAERRRALVCLDLLKSRAAELSISTLTAVQPTSHQSQQLHFSAEWKGDKSGAYGTLQQRALVKEELLPSTRIPTQGFSDGTEFLLCLSDATVLLTCVNTESVMYLKELPELPKLLYITVEIKHSTAGSSHSIKVPSEAEMVLT